VIDDSYELIKEMKKQIRQLRMNPVYEKKGGTIFKKKGKR
jgi:hypothetical protein